MPKLLSDLNEVVDTFTGAGFVGVGRAARDEVRSRVGARRRAPSTATASSTGSTTTAHDKVMFRFTRP